MMILSKMIFGVGIADDTGVFIMDPSETLMRVRFERTIDAETIFISYWSF